MIDISIDLETFDSAPDASIATIGAVAVGPAGVEDGHFYVVVDDPGGSWSPETVRWHAQQVGDTLGRSEGPAMPLVVVLDEFSRWLHYYSANKEGKARLWTHATFDMPVLESAYRRADLERPWFYRNCRDLRTLYDLAGGRPKLERVGTHHNALDDARYQMGEVQHCLEILEDR